MNMANALRDSQKVSSMLAVDKDITKTIPVRANAEGALMVQMEGSSSTGRKLKDVIKLNLGQSREKILFEQSFNEITIPVIEGNLTLYINESTENKGLTINRALSIETAADRFYISNGSGKGQAEIWLWE